MKAFTVSLFGHREIDTIRELENLLALTIKELMRAKSYVIFLVGRNGEFDEYAASVIKRVQKEVGKEKSEIILVLPYKVADVGYYEKYYDNIIIPDGIERAHPKAAITLKNRWIIKQSDLVIVYLKQNRGGAYTAAKYAEKLNKKVINLYGKESLFS